MQLATALLASATPTLSARSQTLQGQVIEERSRRPVGGAALMLIDDSAHAAARTVADSSSGFFYLVAPSPGRYKVRVVVGRGGVSDSPPFTLDSNQVIERILTVPEMPQALRDAYLPEDVTVKAVPKRETIPPRYPDRLRRQGVGGVVRILFVVDSAGKPDMTTLRVLRSANKAFTEAVKTALEQTRFFPATREGAPVPQVQELFYDFGFDSEPPRVQGNNVFVVRTLGVMREVIR